MTELDKIIKQIDDDCSLEADKIIAAANKKASEIIEVAEKQAEDSYNVIIDEGKRSREAELQRASSGAALNNNKELLKAKDAIMRNTASEALDRLKSLPDDEYFNAISQLAFSNSISGEGELLLNKRDNDRLPSGFMDSLNKKLSSKGGKLTLCKVPSNIDSGCILRYEGIEFNCTFDAVFEASYDDIRDKLSSVLFA